jgi:hypothetical protein
MMFQTGRFLRAHIFNCDLIIAISARGPHLRGMPLNPDMRDADFCLRKAKEYRAKAKETNDAELKIAFEAVAREFELRAKENIKGIAAKDSKPRGA